MDYERVHGLPMIRYKEFEIEPTLFVGEGNYMSNGKQENVFDRLCISLMKSDYKHRDACVLKCVLYSSNVSVGEYDCVLSIFLSFDNMSRYDTLLELCEQWGKAYTRHISDELYDLLKEYMAKIDFAAWKNYLLTNEGV